MANARPLLSARVVSLTLKCPLTFTLVWAKHSICELADGTSMKSWLLQGPIRSLTCCDCRQFFGIRMFAFGRRATTELPYAELLSPARIGVCGVGTTYAVHAMNVIWPKSVFMSNWIDWPICPLFTRGSNTLPLSNHFSPLQLKSHHPSLFHKRQQRVSFPAD